jgi:hypothetical protein
MRHGYPMVIVQSKDKENYLNVLHKCDIEVGLNPSDGASAQLEQVEPFIEYMESIARHALEISVKAAKGESIEEEDDFAKRIALLEKEAKSKKEQIKFSETEVWNVLEYFYFPIEKKIMKALQPAISFFSMTPHLNRLSKSASSIDADILNIIDRETTNPKIKDLVSNAKTMFFYLHLQHPKREYNMNNIDIKIEFSIKFEDEYYTVSPLGSKQFSYGTYPSEEEVEKIVITYKTEVIDKIEKAIHGAK